MSKSIKKNYIYNVIYQVLVIIIPIITTPYVSRVLLPEGVGQYSYTYSIITYFILFASLGFEIYAQREIARYQNDKQKQSIIFWEIIICRLIPVVISLITNVLLIFSGFYGKNSVLMSILCIDIITVAFNISFIFSGNEEFGKLVLINIFIKLFATIGIFVFVKTANDVWIYTILHSLSTLLSNIVMWLFLIKLLCRVDKKEIHPWRHFKGTLRLFIPTIAVTIYTVLDKTMIGLITGSEAQNGFYEQSDKIIKLCLTIVTCLGTIMIPRNTNCFEKGNFEQVKNNIYAAFHFVWLLAFPMVIGVICIVDNFVPWFFGIEFSQNIILMKILSLLILIIGISNILGLQYLLPTKHDNKYTIAIICGAVVNLILNIPLIIVCGALGASIATIISEFTVTAVMFCFVRKDLNFKQILFNIWKPLIASLIMFAVIFPISLILTPSILHTLLIVAIGALIYGIIILLLRDQMVINIFSFIKSKFNKKPSPAKIADGE